MKTKGGASASITIEVQKKAVAASAIKVPEKSITLKKGNTYIVKPLITPITCQDKTIYTSSNKKVATVSSKGVKKGTEKITVIAGKKKATITVTVK